MDIKLTLLALHSKIPLPFFYYITIFQSVLRGSVHPSFRYSLNLQSLAARLSAIFTPEQKQEGNYVLASLYLKIL